MTIGPRARAVLLVLTLAAAIAGCGKRVAPVPPTDEPDTYPRHYPAGS